MRNSYLFILILTSVLSAFGPFVTDLYLPVLPVLNIFFDTSVSMVQLSLTVSLIGLASGQLLIGPISDKFGRKIPLLVSLLVFIFSTAGCILSPDINYFIIFRLMQGFSGAGGIVISKSIAVDLYKNKALAKFLSTLSAINGFAPIAAPLCGGLLLKFTDWHGIFFILLCLGILIFAASLFFKESLAVKKRNKGNIFSTFNAFGNILRNKKFIYYTMVLAFAMGTFFCYLSASPYIFQTFYKLTPVRYGIFFGVNALGIICGARIAVRFSTPSKAVSFGALTSVIFTVITAILLFISAHVYIVEAAFFVLLLANGIVLPSATAQALNLETNNAGSASAILGFFQFLFGGVVSPLVGIGNVMYSSGIVIVVCGLLCLLFTKKAVGFRH